jgi:hypothetical protein
MEISKKNDEIVLPIIKNIKKMVVENPPISVRKSKNL